jgi:hypothetical protein
MRSVTLKVAGQSFELPVNFAAGAALAKAGLDPLTFALAVRGGSGSLSALEVISCLHIGITAGGGKMPMDQLGDAVFSEGLMEHLKTATTYLVEFCTAGPEYPVPKA